MALILQPSPRLTNPPASPHAAITDAITRCCLGSERAASGCGSYEAALPADPDGVIAGLDKEHQDALAGYADFEGSTVKVLESTFASAASTGFARGTLAQYTASRSAFDDGKAMLQVLRAGEELAA